MIDYVLSSSTQEVTDEDAPVAECTDWDQHRADRRSLEDMRQIALDALKLDDQGFYTYARKHKIPINKIVYYFNVYEAGGDVGLQAVRAPDIIPPEVARRAIRIITKAVDRFLEDRIPFRVTDEGTGIGVYEIWQRMDSDIFLFAVRQFRLTLATHQWHLYWMRKFDAWWPYSLPESDPKFTLNARLKQLFEDVYSCFWG